MPLAFETTMPLSVMEQEEPGPVDHLDDAHLDAMATLGGGCSCFGSSNRSSRRSSFGDVSQAWSLKPKADEIRKSARTSRFGYNLSSELSSWYRSKATPEDALSRYQMRARARGTDAKVVVSV